MRHAARNFCSRLEFLKRCWLRGGDNADVMAPLISSLWRRRFIGSSQLRRGESFSVFFGRKVCSDCLERTAVRHNALLRDYEQLLHRFGTTTQKSAKLSARTQIQDFFAPSSVCAQDFCKFSTVLILKAFKDDCGGVRTAGRGTAGICSDDGRAEADF